jgi:SPP1 family predicted phage head-tail adaptor
MTDRIFDPGAFTARLTLERAVDVPDGQGGASRTHAVVGHVWARIEPVSAGRVSVAGADALTVTHRIWLRRRSDLESGMRLRKGTRIFAIQSFRDPDEHGRYLACDCEEIEP